LASHLPQGCTPGLTTNIKDGSSLNHIESVGIHLCGSLADILYKSFRVSEDCSLPKILLAAVIQGQGLEQGQNIKQA
jgi:hypothetical protein